MRSHFWHWVLVVLACACLSRAAENYSPSHVARQRFVTAAEISPDGEEIAYLLSVPRRPFVEDNGPAWSELHVVAPNGTSRPYITGKAEVAAIAWKPDSSGISFIQKRGDDKFKSVYSIPLAGGESHKIVEHESDIADYCWSPDGKRIAYTAKDKEPAQEKELKDKGFDQTVYEEKLQPNYVWIADVREADAWADAPDAKPQRFDLKGHATGVIWSASGEYLAVAVAPTPTIDDDYMKRKVHVISAKDGTRVGVIENPGKLGMYRFSPDGKNVALIAGADIQDPNPGRLMVAPSTGGVPVDVRPNLTDGDITSFGWLNNDEMLCLSDRGVTSSVTRVNHKNNGASYFVDYGKHSIGSLSLSKDGKRAALVCDSPQHPPEVFALAGVGSIERLTHNNPWLSDMNLAKQEVVKFRARDGLQLEGILIRPLDEKPGTRYPLVLIVHGGPEAHYRNGWLTAYSNPGQLLAARGFAVFYPNYRGSTGRGVEFSKKGQADYAGKEFDDLVDAVDHLVGTGLVDKDKVGVTGGSYGGFASAWCATKYSDRFAASVMFVGISDLVSKFGTTDIPNEWLLVHARKTPWDDWQFYRDRSPLTHAPQAKTPILIMHGKDDPRVHPSQSMELYRYLRTLGKAPVRLVFYAGEGHGNRKAASRLDYTLRLAQWMEHYLKGSGGDPPPPDLDYSAFKPKEQEKKPEEANKQADRRSK